MEPISRFMIRLLVGDHVADLGGSGPGELAHRGRLVHFGDLEGATASTTLRMTRPLVGSFTSRTLRLTESVSPTLTPSLEPTLTMMVPSGEASATRPSILMAWW